MRLFAKAGQQGIPLMGSFELTSRCTLDCKMCYIHGKSCSQLRAGEKDTEWWLSLGREAKEKGMLQLLLTGGEPMIREDFPKLYSEYKKMGLMVSVNTNGTLINDEIIELFSSMPPQRVNITLYGMSPQVYKDLCGNEGAYEKVIKAIKELHSRGINIRLNYTVTPVNKDDLIPADNFARELGVSLRPVTYLFPPVRRGDNSTIDRLSPEEAAQVHFRWQKNGFGDKFPEYIKNLSLKDTIPETNEECGERINCRAGKSTFWVTKDGIMTPCGMMTTPSADIDKSGFTDAWESIRRERENIILPAECKGCNMRSICDVCAAVTMAETGSFDKVPRYICKKAEELVRLYKGEG